MIKIYNNKITYINREEKEKPIKTSELLSYLDCPLELDGKVTFSTIMSLLYLNKDMVNFLFRHTMGGVDFQDFYDDMMYGKVEKDEENDYKSDYLEVYQCPDIWIFKKDKGVAEFNHSYDFHLIKPSEDIAYGISFSKLSGLKDYRIKIKMEMDVYVNDTTKKIEKDYKPMLKAKLGSFRLYDFLWAILYEISWFGSPTNRDAESEKLVNIVHEYEEDKKDGKVIKTYTLNEVLDKLKPKKKKKKTPLKKRAKRKK